MISRNDPCWCGSGKKWKHCHYPQNPGGLTEEDLRQDYMNKFRILLKNKVQIEGIRRASQLASKILDSVCAHAKEGVTTEELDKLAYKLHMDAGAIPAPLNYGHPPFPKSICTSLNEVICHGIPDNKPLLEGDIVNIDVTSILNGYFGDCSKMVCIGKVSDEKKLVVEVAYECLMRAIAVSKPDALLSDIGEAIESYALSKGCSVVNQFVGHGVGVKFHEPPQIRHYRNNLNIPMKPGMIFTIEPMINAGDREAVVDLKDEWTARTIDGRASAQFEHTILITESGHEILTNWVK